MIEEWDNVHLSSSFPSLSSVCVTVMASEVILATLDDWFVIRNDIVNV